MIDPDIEKEIQRRLSLVETQYDVQVIYAIESGSRAWGFESQNSEYDVRFIYAHPKNWYLGIDFENKRDVIDDNDVGVIALNGWDARKALKLFYQSNPSIVEWLSSPIVYRNDWIFAPELKECIDLYYSVEKGIFHYRSMAIKHSRGHLEKDLVILKKYFNALRAILSAQWLELYKKPAPIELNKLRALIHNQPEINDEVEKLLLYKQQHDDLCKVPPLETINHFILSNIEKLEPYSEKPELDFDSEDVSSEVFTKILNNLFLKILESKSTVA